MNHLQVWSKLKPYINTHIPTFSTGLLESSRNLSANLVASAINLDRLGLIFFAVSNISEHLATRMWYDDCKVNISYLLGKKCNMSKIFGYYATQKEIHVLTY